MKAIIMLKNGVKFEYDQKWNATGAGIRSSAGKTKGMYKKMLNGVLYEITEQKTVIDNGEIVHKGVASRVITSHEAITKKFDEYNKPYKGCTKKVTVVFDGYNNYEIRDNIDRYVRDSEKSGHAVAVIDVNAVRCYAKPVINHRITTITQKMIDDEATNNKKCWQDKKINKGYAYEILLKKMILDEKDPSPSKAGEPDIVIGDTEIEVKYNGRGSNSNTIIVLD